MSIKILDNDTASKIAAGEVITGPSAVIKELLENSIDAKSTNISIIIENGGKKKISVSDNGIGINSNDVSLAFKRHATSKINGIGDLNNLNSLGFRGEALASIATVSKIKLKTHSETEETGCYVEIIGEDIIKIERSAFRRGTTIIVEDLFFNTPVRLKHLKKDTEESRYITEIVEKLALAYPNISFTLSINNKNIIKTPGDGNLLNCILSLFGNSFGEELIEITYENNPLKISGFIGKPYYVKANKKYQFYFINGRYVSDNIISKNIEEAYDTLLMVNKHPVFIINIMLPPDMLDVNVHPAKTKVKFLNESLITLLIKDGVRKTLRDSMKEKSIKIDNKKIEKSINDDTEDKYIQEEVIVQYNNIINEQENKQTIIEDSETNYINKIQKNNINEKNNFNTENEKISKEEKIPSHKKNEFTNAKLIGQIFNTYIAFEKEERLLLIDQHAAHERILYEKIKNDIKNNSFISQNLLVPINISLAPSQYQLLFEMQDLFKKIGFDFDEFGNNTICLRTVPVFFGEPQEGQIIEDILDEMNPINNKEYSGLEEKIILKACKGAVKANGKLDNREIDALIKDLFSCEFPYTCPHGRPTIVGMKKADFEKMFKRII